MLLRLLLLVTLIPAAELAILIWLTKETSLATTVLIVLSTGVLGAAIARWQGFRAWNATRQDLAAGRAPAASVADGVLILFAAALLLLPGLLTDVAGFVLLVPRARVWFRTRLLEYFRQRVNIRMQTFAARAGGFAQGEVIDAEFRRADAASIEQRHE